MYIRKNGLENFSNEIKTTLLSLNLQVRLTISHTER